MQWGDLGLGAIGASILTVIGANRLASRQARAAAVSANAAATVAADVEWKTRILEESTALRHERAEEAIKLRERVAVLEHVAEESQARIETLMDSLAGERETNRQLRMDNASLREANARLTARNEELQAENRAWAQKLTGLQEQIEDLKARP